MSNSLDDSTTENLQCLLEHFMRNCYKARENDTKTEQIMNNCLELFGKDYKYTVVYNPNGELCSHYPTKIVILEYAITDKSHKQDSPECVESLYDVGTLKDIFNKARFARCRARFVVPVILYNGKHICRSATISGGAEIYGRSGFDFFMTGGESIPDEGGHLPPNCNGSMSTSGSSTEWQLFNRIRGQDIRVLKTFSVGYICDFMVEKKKVKFFMNVTSSEKVDKEHRYADFSILSLPYPGCEFFREWKDSGYRAEVMNFDWNQGYVDAELDIPSHPTPPRNIDWLKYQNWDLIQLTQNYLHLLLHYVREGDSGLLVHCISGWDRTPLFISLLRLTLWADGLIHTSLTPAEILYLTIAYDWYLFGHNLPDRTTKGEEVFFFCFHFLKYLTSDEFSVSKGKRHQNVSRHNSESTMDGVLLDHDLQRASYRGSNTSINSNSSLNSTKSSVDNAPIYFSAGSAEEDTFVGHSTLMNNNPQNRLPEHPHRPIPEHSSRGGVSTHSNSSSPMAVPAAVRNLSDLRNSPNSYSGSWQIISGCGSLRGSTSSPNSVSADADHATNGHCTHSHDHQDTEEPQRKQRLDAVRRIFMTMYTTLLDSPPSEGGGITSSSSGISGILGNFAERVGFKSGRSSDV